MKMKKVVGAVAIGVGVATVILAVLRIVKKAKKGDVKAPKFYSDCDNETIGI